MQVALTLNFSSVALAVAFLAANPDLDAGINPEASATTAKGGKKTKAAVDSLGNPEGTRYFMNTAVEGVFKMLPGDAESGVPSKEITAAEFQNLSQKIAQAAVASAQQSTATATANPEFDPFAAEAAAPAVQITKEVLEATLRKVAGVPVHGRTELTAILDTASTPNAAGQKLVSGIAAEKFAAVHADALKVLAKYGVAA